VKAGNALAVIANPSPASFSHAMAEAAAEVLRNRGYEICSHDLYAEKFDPVQRSGEGGNRASSDELVETHCRQLARADLILVFHPNWWGQPPAILKGWRARKRSHGIDARESRAGVQYVEHDVEARGRGFRQSSRRIVEELRFRPVRSRALRASCLRTDVVQHAAAA
jgi:putative NADPH-quinone reductase